MSVHLQPAEKPITEDDATIARMLEHASVPTLMMSIVHVTGDTSLLRGAIRPKQPMIGEYRRRAHGRGEGRRARRMALEALKAYRDRGCTLPPPPSPGHVREMMSFIVGERRAGRVRADDARGDRARRRRRARVALETRVPAAARERLPRARHRRRHVGAAGRACGSKQAGIPFVDRREERRRRRHLVREPLPGLPRRHRQPLLLATRSSRTSDWSEFFSQRDELREYFRALRRRYGVRGHIRFSTEVIGCALRRAVARWRVRARGADGGEETMRGQRASISAVGQLNRPKHAGDPGSRTFAGRPFHSASWRAEHRLDGKRVAVVGTGASALPARPRGREAGRAGSTSSSARRRGWCRTRAITSA